MCKTMIAAALATCVLVSNAAYADSQRNGSARAATSHRNSAVKFQAHYAQYPASGWSIGSLPKRDDLEDGKAFYRGPGHY